jgi:hypothetical protein
MAEKPNPLTDTTDEQEVTIESSEEANDWALKTINNNPAHPWHGFECKTCLGRYVVLTTAFDAGMQVGIDKAADFQMAGKRSSGIIMPGEAGGT